MQVVPLAMLLILKRRGKIWSQEQTGPKWAITWAHPICSHQKLYQLRWAKAVPIFSELLPWWAINQRTRIYTTKCYKIKWEGRQQLLPSSLVKSIRSQEIPAKTPSELLIVCQNGSLWISNLVKWTLTQSNSSLIHNQSSRVKERKWWESEQMDIGFFSICNNSYDFKLSIQILCLN